MEKVRVYKQPWINSALSDTLFILMPPFLALLVVTLFPQQFKESDEMPLMYWLILIVFIDVAHVYSTLYRTYFNSMELKEKQSLLVSIPLACYVTGVICYNIDSLFFWRILAYLAVFHFIRQQYGFMRLFSRFEKKSRFFKLFDTVVIYTATLYPIIYWHLSDNRNFNWFVEGDFIKFNSSTIASINQIAYLLILFTYIGKEIFEYIKSQQLNIPRNLLIIGTALSWYFGIVYFNGDAAFTTLNVISHGIPYMALIWFFEKERFKRSSFKTNRILKVTFGSYGIIAFILLIVFLAYMEEGLWDGLIWKEHTNLFTPFASLPRVEDKKLLSLLVPLLALPQFTHYVLDGFIWRRNYGREKVN